MKLGLFGIDSQIATILTAARRQDDRIVLACDVAIDSPYASLLDGVPLEASWEAFADARVCDAVLVGATGWNDQRAEGVRKLVQTGRTLLVSQPLSLSMLWAYEIDMICKDSGARVIPYLPDRLHPFIARLRQTIEASSANGEAQGVVETVSLERRMPDRSRDSVLQQLARDADLVRMLVGDPQRLSTLSGATPQNAWGTLAVGFTGTSHVPIRWQVMHGDDRGLRVTLAGSGASTVVDIPDSQSVPWQWSTDCSLSMPPQPVAFDRGAVMLAVLHQACEPRKPLLQQVDLLDEAASWADASRAIELAETVPRSVMKGRTIDLHQEEFSEISTFKGTMASLGCAIVLGALLLLFVATLAGGIAKELGWSLGEQIAGVWPMLVLAVLGIFLALQILPFLVGSGPNRQVPPTHAVPKGQNPRHK